MRWGALEGVVAPRVHHAHTVATFKGQTPANHPKKPIEHHQTAVASTKSFLREAF